MLVEYIDRFNCFGLSRMKVNLFPSEKSVERLHESLSKEIEAGLGSYLYSKWN